MIYLVSPDGHRDSLILDRYATNADELAGIVEWYCEDMFGWETKNIEVNMKYMEITFLADTCFCNDFDKMKYRFVEIHPQTTE